MPNEKSFFSFFRKKSTDSISNASENTQKQNVKKFPFPSSQDNDDLRYMVYDTIRTIKDPEKPATLEDLSVVYEDGIMVNSVPNNDTKWVRVEFNPTVPHCSLATLIGLCIRIKMERNIPYQFKLDIFIKKGAHTTEEEINKQINDKERIAAAMENPSLKEMVEKCIAEED